MSGTTISNLPAAGSVSTSDLFVKVALGSPNVTERCTGTQIFNALAGFTVPGTLSASNGTTGTQAVNFSQFGASLGANGLFKIPGGVTVQWGVAATSGSGPSTATITFPTAFSNSPYGAWCTIITNNNAIFEPFAIAVNTLGASTMQVYSFNTALGIVSPAVATFFWVVIGPT
ncbi:MAG: hypothetical protein KGL39_26300 [Patescibacteria group bacterium]|nr:hypothetical protein [Patescibacteria group bacterium]